MTLNRYFCAFTFSLCLFLVPLSAHTKAQPKEQGQTKQSVNQDTSLYRQLVKRAMEGDSTVDFGQLRKAFVDWIDDENNQTDAPNRAEMVEAFKKEDYARAVDLVEVVLEYEFISRGLHLAAADAYTKLGNKAKADFHKNVALRLMQALLSTGDGKTVETAYRVLNIREEYVIMEELGYDVVSQALVSTNDGEFDLLTGKDKKSGKSVSLYFDFGGFGGRKKTKK